MAPKKNYKPEQMALALEAVRRGVSVAAAAKQYGVPRVTLLYKKNGKSPSVCRMGPATILSENEENALVTWVLELSKRHFPVSKNELLDSVQHIMKNKKCERTFKNDGRPTDKWFTCFLKRHPVLSQRISQNLSQSRENVKETQIRGWFEEIQEYFRLKNLSSVCNDPHRVFNADETAFFLTPKGEKVLAGKGDKNVYCSAGDEKENLTVLVTANAAGKLAPPMIVFSYIRIPSYICQNIPKEWAVGISENGWMCSATFYEYVTNIFTPWLDEQKIQRPVILYVDGHVSHMTLHLSNFCLANGIELVALYPNSTHLLQPMDVSVFRPLKVYYRKELQIWRMENYGNKLQKQNFAAVLEKALKHINENTITNGFRVSGLCPFDVSNVQFIKIAKPALVSVTSQKFEVSDKIILKGVEERLGVQKLEKFKSCLQKCEMWTGPVEDTSLFEFWRDLKLENTRPNINEQENENRTNIEVDKMDENQNSNFLDGEQVEENQNKVDKSNNETELVDKENRLPTQKIPLKMNNNSNFLDGEQVEENENKVDKSNNETELVDKQNRLPTQKTPLKINNNNIPFNVPTPFKKALFWPDPKPSTKKRMPKEKIPSVVTSEAWRSYHIKKDFEKKEKMEQKEKRKILKRQKNLDKIEQEAMKKVKKVRKVSESDSSDVEEWADSEDSLFDVDFVGENETDVCDLEDSSNVSVGDYVLVKFIGGKRNATTYKYVCVIQDKYDNGELEVMSMKATNKEKTVFTFNENDVSCVTNESILGVLPPPEILGTGERLKYEFPSAVEVFEA